MFFFFLFICCELREQFGRDNSYRLKSIWTEMEVTYVYDSVSKEIILVKLSLLCGSNYQMKKMIIERVEHKKNLTLIEKKDK